MQAYYSNRFDLNLQVGCACVMRTTSSLSSTCALLTAPTRVLWSGPTNRTRDLGPRNFQRNETSDPARLNFHNNTAPHSHTILCWKRLKYLVHPIHTRQEIQKHRQIPCAGLPVDRPPVLGFSPWLAAEAARSEAGEFEKGILGGPISAMRGAYGRRF